MLRNEPFCFNKGHRKRNKTLQQNKTIPTRHRVAKTTPALHCKSSSKTEGTFFSRKFDNMKKRHKNKILTWLAFPQTRRDEPKKSNKAKAKHSTRDQVFTKPAPTTASLRLLRQTSNSESLSQQHFFVVFRVFNNAKTTSHQSNSTTSFLQLTRFRFGSHVGSPENSSLSHNTTPICSSCSQLPFFQAIK